MKQVTACAVFASVMAACGSGRQTPTAPTATTAPTPEPPPSVPTTARGAVTDRVAGGPISGSKITWRATEGTAVEIVSDATIVNGQYEVSGLQRGVYEVTITGPSHVEHKTQKLAFPQDGTIADFSVLKWGSSRFGITFDESFFAFYNSVARFLNEENRDGRVQKWHSSLPSEVYVFTRNDLPSDRSYRMLTPAEMAQVYSVVEEINDGMIADMFCNRTGPLRLIQGPPGPNMGFRRNSFVIGALGYTTGGGGASLYNQRGRGTWEDENADVAAASISLSIGPQTTLSSIRAVLAHEVFHGAFAGHASTQRQHASLMNSGPPVRPADKLAACIVYHPDTHPGNLPPDTNPSYRVSSSAGISRTPFFSTRAAVRPHWQEDPRGIFGMTH